MLHPLTDVYSGSLGSGTDVLGGAGGAGGLVLLPNAQRKKSTVAMILSNQAATWPEVQ